MKRIGIIGLCFAAVLAFSVVAVASASAAEVLSSSATGSFKATSGEAKLNGSSEVKCTGSVATGTFETAHLGKATIVFSGCKTGIFNCTGASEPTGRITVSGPFHLGLARKVSTEPAHAAILFLVTPIVKFTCAGIGAVEVQGNVIGLLFNKAGTEPLVAGEPFLASKIIFKDGGTTKQEDKEFLLSLTTPENEPMTAKLESNLFGGGFSEAGQEATGTITEVSPVGAGLVAG